MSGHFKKLWSRIISSTIRPVPTTPARRAFFYRKRHRLQPPKRCRPGPNGVGGTDARMFQADKRKFGAATLKTILAPEDTARVKPLDSSSPVVPITAKSRNTQAIEVVPFRLRGDNIKSGVSYLMEERISCSEASVGTSDFTSCVICRIPTSFDPSLTR